MYKISQLAQAAGVNVETIRYYQRRQLIEQPHKPSQGHRRYPAATLARIRFIKRAQRLGLTLQEIANLLKLDEANCHDVQHMASLKLANVQAKMADLAHLERQLCGLLDQCADNPDKQRCPIIESLLPIDTKPPL